MLKRPRSASSDDTDAAAARAVQMKAKELPGILGSFFPLEANVSVVEPNEIEEPYTIMWRRVSVHVWNALESDTRYENRTTSTKSRFSNKGKAYATCISAAMGAGTFEFTESSDVHVIVLFHPSSAKDDSITAVTTTVYAALPPTAAVIRTADKNGYLFPATPLQRPNPDVVSLVDDDESDDEDDNAYENACLRLTPKSEDGSELSVLVFVCVNPYSDYVHTSIGKQFITQAAIEHALPMPLPSFLEQAIYFYNPDQPLTSSSISAKLIRGNVKDKLSPLPYCMLFYAQLHVAQLLLLADDLDEKQISDVLAKEMDALGSKPAWMLNIICAYPYKQTILIKSLLRTADVAVLQYKPPSGAPDGAPPAAPSLTDIQAKLRERFALIELTEYSFVTTTQFNNTLVLRDCAYLHTFSMKEVNTDEDLQRIIINNPALCKADTLFTRYNPRVDNGFMIVVGDRTPTVASIKSAPIVSICCAARVFMLEDYYKPKDQFFKGILTPAKVEKILSVFRKGPPVIAGITVGKCAVLDAVCGTMKRTLERIEAHLFVVLGLDVIVLEPASPALENIYESVFSYQKLVTEDLENLFNEDKKSWMYKRSPVAAAKSILATNVTDAASQAQQWSDLITALKEVTRLLANNPTRSGEATQPFSVESGGIIDYADTLRVLEQQVDAYVRSTDPALPQVKTQTFSTRITAEPQRSIIPEVKTSFDILRGVKTDFKAFKKAIQNGNPATTSLKHLDLRLQTALLAPTVDDTIEKGVIETRSILARFTKRLAAVRAPAAIDREGLFVSEAFAPLPSPMDDREDDEELMPSVPPPNAEVDDIGEHFSPTHEPVDYDAGANAAERSALDEGNDEFVLDDAGSRTDAAKPCAPALRNFGLTSFVNASLQILLLFAPTMGTPSNYSRTYKAFQRLSRGDNVEEALSAVLEGGWEVAPFVRGGGKFEGASRKRKEEDVAAYIKAAFKKIFRYEKLSKEFRIERTSKKPLLQQVYELYASQAFLRKDVIETDGYAFLNNSANPLQLMTTTLQYCVACWTQTVSLRTVGTGQDLVQISEPVPVSLGNYMEKSRGPMFYPTLQCKTCGRQGCVFRRRLPAPAPLYLQLQLDSSDNTSTAPVLSPHELRLPLLARDSTIVPASARYTLIGSIRRKSTETMTHYTATVRCADETKWALCDDDDIRTLSTDVPEQNDRLLQEHGNAYMLFYKRASHLDGPKITIPELEMFVHSTVHNVIHLGGKQIHVPAVAVNVLNKVLSKFTAKNESAERAHFINVVADDTCVADQELTSKCEKLETALKTARYTRLTGQSITDFVTTHLNVMTYTRHLLDNLKLPYFPYGDAGFIGLVKGCLHFIFHGGASKADLLELSDLIQQETRRARVLKYTIVPNVIRARIDVPAIQSVPIDFTPTLKTITAVPNLTVEYIIQRLREKYPLLE
jgi:hypothetical protein